ncbi:MAG: hypothetical protein JRI23_33885, partial [Deltaproteobacteria bacterium]|nr:hypothetical protein [Deltaproteobacteria bacterium]MBW2537284.1 hypothetical protein [Deltaproteobacteria bacterium]
MRRIARAAPTDGFVPAPTAPRLAVLAAFVVATSATVDLVAAPPGRLAWPVLWTLCLGTAVGSAVGAILGWLLSRLRWVAPAFQLATWLACGALVGWWLVDELGVLARLDGPYRKLALM